MAFFLNNITLFLLSFSSFVNVQVHHKESQPLEVMKLLTIYTMETARLFCGYPMESICLVFNLENFTLSNMVSANEQNSVIA
jgi:hypothetical protein